MEIEYIYYYPYLKDIDTVDIETEVNDSNFYTIIMIYRELVKKYKDLRVFISENGRKWYEENCHLENYIKIIFDRLDLDKLK